MGRLSNLQNTTFTNGISTLSGSTTGLTNVDVHIFVDESGNVTQIKKSSKPRLKYYIDPNFPGNPITPYCVIGVSDPEEGECSEGVALGIGDTMMAYAVYNII